MDANFFSEKIDGTGFQIGIVRARFNEEITGNLLASCESVLKEAKVEDIDIVTVPGSVEIPYALKQLAKENKYDALIALGAIVKGSTPHFELIAGAVQNELARISVEENIPVIAGVITTLTMEQAIERSGDGPLNRGVEAAHVALEMVKCKKERGW